MNTVKERIEFLMLKTVITKLDDYAKTVGETRSTVIRRAINEYLDKQIDKYFEEEQRDA
jgi:metal-responsive CopG/Arc/MetJ family transcriptional regulator